MNSSISIAEFPGTYHDGCLPIVFDDAFAYSATERFQPLQCMLDLAATCGLQITFLTYSPNDYSWFGSIKSKML